MLARRALPLERISWLSWFVLLALGVGFATFLYLLNERFDFLDETIEL
jgi:hypothetical protein